MKRPHHDPVAMRVVTLIGGAAILGLLLVSLLVYKALGYEGDPQTVNLINTVGNLASAALGALAAILATTGKGAAPTPVTVENKKDDPVPTEPTTPVPTEPTTPLVSEFE